ncbi:hypothetical protein EV401DRAFT_1882029 [Pisolithus croceorrhizus]|nr:hypothetical protein EV401DRAFT_1882029 [Pisolithus croceorrhizus]
MCSVLSGVYKTADLDGLSRLAKLHPPSSPPDLRKVNCASTTLTLPSNQDTYKVIKHHEVLKTSDSCSSTDKEGKVDPNKEIENGSKESRSKTVGVTTVVVHGVSDRKHQNQLTQRKYGYGFRISIGSDWKGHGNAPGERHNRRRSPNFRGPMLWGEKEKTSAHTREMISDVLAHPFHIEHVDYACDENVCTRMLSTRRGRRLIFRSLSATVADSLLVGIELVSSHQIGAKLLVAILHRRARMDDRSFGLERTSLDLSTDASSAHTVRRCSLLLMLEILCCWQKDASGSSLAPKVRGDVLAPVHSEPVGWKRGKRVEWKCRTPRHMEDRNRRGGQFPTEAMARKVDWEYYDSCLEARGYVLARIRAGLLTWVRKQTDVKWRVYGHWALRGWGESAGETPPSYGGNDGDCHGGWFPASRFSRAFNVPRTVNVYS